MTLIILVTLLNKKTLYQINITSILSYLSFWLTLQLLVNDHFRKTIIKLYKKKIRLSSNAKSDQFLQKVIILNILSLWKIKKVMAYANKLTSHGNYYSIVSSVSDLI